MFLIYVDESGDTGVTQSPTRHFALSGLVLHELDWLTSLDELVQFRQSLRQKYQLKVREEIHASHMLHKPADLARIPKHQRLLILRDTLDFVGSSPKFTLINVIVDKQQQKYTSPESVFDMAWQCLIQRFYNAISKRSLSGARNPQDHGLLVVDKTDEARLRGLTRRMRRFNPVPSMYGGSARQLPTHLLVEDAVHRDSKHSLFIQLVDVCCFFLYQKQQPAGYIKRKGARNWFDRLDPVLLKQASRTDPQGIVRV